MNLHETIEAARTLELPVETAPIEKLALLDRYRQRGRGDFADMDCLFVQHMLAPFHARVRAMLDDGLDPRAARFVDIPYSTNAATRQALAGIVADENSIAPPFESPFERYSEAQQRRLAGMLDEIGGDGLARPVLVVDDGAYVLRALADEKTSGSIRERFRGAHLVEQTTRGHRFLESPEGHRAIHELGIVAVSVARTATKVMLEGPLLGDAVGRAVARRVAGHGPEPRRILVIGYGTIGSAAVRELRRVFPRATLSVVDANRDRRRIAASLGCAVHESVVALEAEPCRFDLVVGCTGGTSLTLDRFGLLAEECILASGSSAAVEFDRAGLVERAGHGEDTDLRLLTEANEIAGIRADLRFRYRDRVDMTLLNAGFPVNFDGEPEHIPTAFIGPTHCLLYAAAAQAVRERTPGLRLLEPREDYWILEAAIDDMQRLLEKTPSP